MSGEREAVLQAIRNALGREQLPDITVAALQRRLTRPGAVVVPKRGQTSGNERIERFIAEAQRVNATTARVPSGDAVPGAVANFLKTANLPATIKLAPSPKLQRLPWDREPLLEVTSGAPSATDRTTVTPAFAGVAETGTVVMLSGRDSPTSLNFLPETHIIVLPCKRIFGTYEEMWAKLRSERPRARRMPRVVNWITGPSRTADIEQTLLLGAHGPRLLHILIVDAED
jgi:L-lactate dehydrogenase complex protein LldG